MIRLTDLLDNIAVTVLDQTHFIDGETFTIAANRKRNVYIAINAAIRAICTRFPIAQNTFFLDQYDHITHYLLHKKFSWSHTSEYPDDSPKYIQDSPDYPFQGNVQRVLFAFNEFGEPIPIDDADNSESIFILRDNQDIYIPRAKTGNSLEIIYWTIFDGIEFRKTGFDEADIELRIPVAFMQALTYFVGSLLLDSKLSANDQIQAVPFLSRYEQELVTLENSGLIHTRGITENRFDDRGFK